MSSVQYSYVKRWRTEMKSALVYASGGKCSICNYSRCEAGLEFHHIDPKGKDFAISAWKSLNTGSITDEVSKCILVCCRCHREIHANVILINGMTSTFDMNEFIKKYEELKHLHSVPCYICGSPIPKNKKYCSRECKRASRGGIAWNKQKLESLMIDKNMTFDQISVEYNISANSIKYYAIRFGLYIPKTNPTPYNRKAPTRKPDKDTLEKMISTYSLSDIGRQFGVSCNSVRKWCKSYNMGVHKFNSFTYDDLISCYNKKMIKAEIIKTFGIGKERLNDMCKKYNIVFPSPNIKYDSSIINKVIEMRNNGIKFKDISIALNLSVSTLQHLYSKRNNT